jgi:drug/metabolite transporter (DMT)-like permease
VRSKRLLLGVLFYGVSIPFYLTALRLLPLSVAYPMTSLTYVWSALLAARYLRERVTPARWMGIAMIIVGIVLVSA